MKNVVIGLIGLFMTVYMIVISMQVSVVQMHRNQLENIFSRVMHQTLKEGFQTKNEQAAFQMLEKELAESLSNEGRLTVQVEHMDLEKGILSAAVTEELSLITGEKKILFVEKTILMDRQAVEEPMVTVTFLRNDELYKEYQLVKGEICPEPFAPSEPFAGWAERGKEYNGVVVVHKPVWTDIVYVAME